MMHFPFVRDMDSHTQHGCCATDAAPLSQQGAGSAGAPHKSDNWTFCHALVIIRAFHTYVWPLFVRRYVRMRV
jgi:hypothetical protein